MRAWARHAASVKVLGVYGIEELSSNNEGKEVVL